MQIADAIEILQTSLSPEVYARYRRSLDQLANDIINEEKDDYYRNHPEETDNG